jgi:transposase
LKPYRDLTDEEWQRVAPLLPELHPRAETRGRPLINTRAVLNAVLWVVFSGASWATLPRKYPSYQTCHRRFKIWHETGVFDQVLQRLFGASAGEIAKVVSKRMRTSQRHAGAPADNGRVAGGDTARVERTPDSRVGDAA